MEGPIITKYTCQQCIGYLKDYADGPVTASVWQVEVLTKSGDTRRGYEVITLSDSFGLEWPPEWRDVCPYLDVDLRTTKN